MTDHETAIVTHIGTYWVSVTYTKPSSVTATKIPGTFHDCVKVFRLFKEEIDKTSGFIRYHEAFWILVSGRVENSGEYCRTLLKTYGFPKPEPHVKVDYLGFLNNFFEYQLTFDFTYTEAR